MSVINQMLSQLEQRGAHTVADQPMVRAVQRTGHNLTMPLLVGALGVVAGIAVSQWAPPRNLPVAAETVAPKTDTTRSTDAGEKLTPQSVAITTGPASGVSANALSAESLASAVRLSAELVPQLPATIRLDAGLAASPFAASPGPEQAGNSNPSASSAPVAKPGKGRPASRPRAVPATAEVVAASAPVETVPMKQVSPAQQADAEFRRAVTMMEQGHVSDAMAGYEAVLHLDAGHDAARQALVALLLEQKRNADAEEVLLDGLGNKPEHIGFTMLLARVQVERGAIEQAIATLEKSLPLAAAQADYRAFLAALLQRHNRNDEAISHYQIVLQQAPDNGVWLTGYGISLQAAQRNEEAKDAFRRALDTRTLSPELQAFVQQKLKGP